MLSTPHRPVRSSCPVPALSSRIASVAWITANLVTQVCFASEEPVGTLVMPQMDCAVQNDGVTVDLNAVPLPLRVLSRNGKDLTTDAGVVLSSKVVPLQESIAYYSSVLNKDSGCHSARRFRAISFALRKNFESAIRDIEIAVEATPDNAYYTKTFADILYQSGNVPGAELYYRKTIELQPRLISAYINWAAMLMKNSKYSKADSLLSKAIQIDPKRHQAWALRGLCRGIQGRVDRGVNDLGVAIGLSDCTTYRYDRGSLFLTLELYEQMLADANKAILLSPGAKLPYLARAYALIKLGRNADALGQVNKFIERNGPLGPALRIRCVVWSRMHEGERQLADLKNWTLNDTKDAAAQADLALFLSTHPLGKLRDGNLAVRHAQRACEATQFEEFVPLSALAAAKAEVGEFESAVKHQTQAIAIAEQMLNLRERQRLALIEEIGEEPDKDDQLAVEWSDLIAAAETNCRTSKWLRPIPIDRLSILHAENGDTVTAAKLQRDSNEILRAVLLDAMNGHLVAYEKRMPQRTQGGNYFEEIIESIGFLGDTQKRPLPEL